ncbi:Hypothetical Protein FCC1311_117832, partial [Hondaea fermentalgiana]
MPSPAATSSTSGATTSENRRKKRKRYSDSDKLYIVRTFETFGRDAAMTAADEIDMPRPSAATIMLRYQKEGKESIHDKRVDTGVPARNSKREPWQTEVLCNAPHWDATMTLKSLLAVLNTEIGRRILCEEQDKNCQTCKHLLSNNERETGHPLELMERMECACDSAKELYEKKHIHNERTIRNWLTSEPLLYTRKVIVKQKTSTNTEAHMRKRYEYAQEVLKYLEERRFFPIFLDEMPFYSTLSSSMGRSPKGTRAVVLVPPESNLTHRTRVVMAVHPQEGLIYGDSFSPTKKGRNYKAQYGKKEFKEYLQGLFQTLMDGENPRTKVRYAETFRNRQIRIIWDNASDHGSRREAAMSEYGIPEDVKPENFDIFVSFVHEYGANVKF